MLGCKPVADRQSPQSAGTAGLGHHAAVTADGAGAIAAAVKEDQNTGGIASWGDRPLTWQAVHIDWLERDIFSHWPDRSHFVQPLPPLRPALRPRLRGQQGSDHFEFIGRLTALYSGLV